MGTQIGEDGVDPLDRRSDPVLRLLQEGDEVGGGTPRRGPGQRVAGRRLEGAEDVALAAPPVVELLLGTLGGTLGHVDELLAREALRRLRTHLVEADDDAASGSGGGARLAFP